MNVFISNPLPITQQQLIEAHDTGYNEGYAQYPVDHPFVPLRYFQLTNLSGVDWIYKQNGGADTVLSNGDTVRVMEADLVTFEYRCEVGGLYRLNWVQVKYGGLPDFVSYANYLLDFSDSHPELVFPVPHVIFNTVATASYTISNMADVAY